MNDINRRRNLGFFFDQSVARAPDKVAIIDLFGGKERRATYRQLDARMNAVASMLARLGVVPGERVAMVIGNRTEFLEFFFGSMRAGAIPLPLNIRLAAPTLAQIIADARCVLAVVDPSSHRDALAASPASHPRSSCGRFSLLRGGGGQARSPGRSAGDRRRRASVSALYLG